NIIFHKYHANFFTDFQGRGQDTGQPPIGKITFRFLKEFQLPQLTQFGNIIFVVGPSCRYPIIQNFHLPTTYPSKYIAHPIIVANGGMLVMGGIVTGLGSQKHRFFLYFRIFCQQGPATGSSDNFISITGKYSNSAKSPAFKTLVAASQGFSTILYYRYIVF